MTPQPRGNAEDVSRKWKGAERLFKTVFCGRPSLWTYAGIRWTSKWPLCTSAGSRKALRARIRSSAANCRRCGGSSASKRPGPPFVFTSERSAPFTTAGFARMVERAGSAAKLRFKAHPHMLRHATGYALASRGTIPAPCKPIWGIRTSSTLCATPNCHQRGSKTSGGNDAGRSDGQHAEEIGAPPSQLIS